MKDTKLVSIIVPVYGVEAYLEECLDSLITQTYKNLEIILIDDESLDRCPQICDEYAEKDNRIKVIHQKNGGAGKARNTGLSQIQGEYVCFVDSDDYVSKDYVSSLVTTLEKGQADIVVSGFFTVYINEMIKSTRTEMRATYSTIEYLEYFLKDWSCSLIWNKMFKAELLSDIRFVEGRKIDDEFFTYQTVMKAKKIVCTEKYLYYYRMRKSGVMSQSKSKLDAERVFKDQHDYYVERYEKVTKSFGILKSIYLENLMENLISLKHRAYGFERIQMLTKTSVRKLSKDLVFGPVSLRWKYMFWRNMLLPAKKIETIHNNKDERELFS